MKKIIIFFLSFVFVAAALSAQQAGPELLKDKSNFAKTELFEPETIFMDRQTNIEVLQAYEANPAAYKDEELLPVAICYMTMRDFDKAKTMLEKFMQAKPENVRALRTYGTIQLLSGNYDDAFKAYEKAAAHNDAESIKSIASACILLSETKDSKVSLENMGKYLEQLKNIAKDDLQTANMILIYAYRDKDKRDLALAKSVTEAMDIEKTLASATPDSLATALNLYMIEKSVWAPETMVIPARGAILAGHWSVANQIYGEVLAANPKNTNALRGKAIVEYNLGGIMDSAEILEKAAKLGDKGAISDAMELVIITAKTNKAQSDKIYSKFKKDFAKADFGLQTRLAMLAHAINVDGQADVFFMALAGDAAKELLKAQQLEEVIKKGIEKYEGDMRAIDLKKRFEEAKK